MEVPSSQGLEAIVRFTNTDKLHQKLLYLQCIPAAAATSKYRDNIDALLPLMEELGYLDDDQPEEVKLEIAVQLPALGKDDQMLFKLQLVQTPLHLQILHVSHLVRSSSPACGRSLVILSASCCR